MHQVVAAIIGAMASWLGHLLSQWLAGSARTEALDRRLKVLALHRRLQQAGIGLDELERLERRLMGKRDESDGRPPAK